MKEQLKMQEISLFRMDYDSLHKEIEEIAQNISNTSGELEDAKKEKEESKSRYESIEQEIEDFDKNIEKKKEKVNQDKMLIQNFESDILVTKEKIASAAKGKEYYKERTDGLQASIDEQEKELAGYMDEQKEALDTLNGMQKKE